MPKTERRRDADNLPRRLARRRADRVTERVNVVFGRSAQQKDIIHRENTGKSMLNEHGAAGQKTAAARRRAARQACQ
jgi:hypothetical protein